MSASAPFSDVVRMLEDCAKGHTIRLATHSRPVVYKGRVFRGLPKFKDVELGHIRKMIRFLRLDWNCARKYLPV